MVFTDHAENIGKLFLSFQNIISPDDHAIDLWQLPPSPPEGIFDVRFASDRSLEVMDDKQKMQFPILLSSAVYPVTISWEMDALSGQQPYLLMDGTRQTISDRGSLEISDPIVKMSIGSEGSGYYQLPLAFSLEQNYPNPFNPLTHVRFAIPELRWVSLKIFDILGREVVTLVNEVKEPGTYSLRWDVGQLTGGVYFYTLRAGNFIETKKMVIMK